MIADDLRALIETAGRATPGPWVYTPGVYELDGDEQCCTEAPGVDAKASATESIFTVDMGDYYALSDANAAYIAACSPERIVALARVALAALGLEMSECFKARLARLAEYDAALAALREVP